MLQEVMAYCREHELIQENENIVAGISGGADSMCLLFLLHQMQPLLHLQLVVVHVDHGIREEAGEDAKYVESMCRKWDIPFFLYEVNAPEYARVNHLSEEEAGRTLRYEAFEEILEQYFQGDGRIAVAHNSNDRSETVLFHLFRGTGIKGLTGITTSRDKIIRPLLNQNRSEIEAYLNQNKIAYCIDRTNAEDTYTRNRIRRHVIAYATEHVCVRANEHINEAADLLEETEALLQKLSDQVYDKCVTMEKESCLLNCELLAQEEPLLVRYCIMRCVSMLTKGAKDITAAHIKAIAGLIGNQVGKRVSLPYGLQAVREYETIRLGSVQEAERSFLGEEDVDAIEVCLPQADGREVRYSFTDEKGENRELVLTSFLNEKSLTIPEKRYTKWFDYDKIMKSLILRTRETGDYLMVDESGSRKKLKDYLINEKVPQEMRDRVPLLVEDRHVLWVIGRRISQYYKVTKETTRILQVRVRGGADNGGDD